MINDLRSAGITTWDLKDVEIEVQNMVATYALHYPEDYDGNDKFTGEPQAGQPRKLNLNNLTFHLPFDKVEYEPCLLYTSPSPRDKRQSRMPSSA